MSISWWELCFGKEQLDSLNLNRYVLSFQQLAKLGNSRTWAMYIADFIGTL